MTQITPNELRRPGEKDEQATILQGPPEKPPDVMQTGIQATSTAPRLEVGPVPLTRVAEYELIKEVGRGGMGVVFKARDVRLNRIVALKMIRGGELANSDELQRFEKEANAAAQLKHPNIVGVYRVSDDKEQPFLSMEFIGGTSLAERLSLGPLSGRRAAEYLELTARAVHYAHMQGIIHRDLKPANVLLDEHDQPKVTDFGLAKQMTSRSDQTRTGAILGTPSYMSPEQAAGSKDIGPASDVYSLGAVLYELMTGKPPFCGETPLATLNLVTEQEPIAPRLLNPAVDRDLETICLKCLEKTPVRRYESADALADDLHRYLQGEPIAARRVSIIGRGVKWCKRNKASTGVTAMIVVMFTAFLSFSWYETYTVKGERDKADVAKEEAVKANEIAANRLAAMRHLLYLSEMRQAQQTMRRADLDGALRILNEHWQPQKDQRDLRDWEWYFLKDRCETRLGFGTHRGQAFAVAYRPDGKELASAGGVLHKPGAIELWDLRTGKHRTLTGHANTITALAYHPDQPLLASASYDKTVKLWNLDTGNEIMTLSGHTDRVGAVIFSPKGDRLASASDDLSVRVWDYGLYPRDPGQSMQVLRGHDHKVKAVAFHPEGRLLASGGQDKKIHLWNLAHGQIERTFDGHRGDVNSLVFYASGKSLISGGGSRKSLTGEVLFWNVETAEIVQSRYGLSNPVMQVSASHDGKVAAALADGMVRLWNRSASSEALSLRADPQGVAGVAFAPDGFSFASAGHSGRVSLWNSSAGSETLNLSFPGDVQTVVFNPKGPFVAAAGARGDVRAWHLEHPERPIVFPGPEKTVFALAFSPDGNSLASGGDDHLVRIYDFQQPNKKPLLLEGHTLVHAVAYRPDGGLLASAGDDDVIRLWDPATGQQVKTLVGHTNGVRCLAFSPDGNWLASGSFDKSIRLWDLKTGSVHTLEGHLGWVNAVAFSPVNDKDTLTLASASADKTIRVWDAVERKELYVLEGTPGPVQSLAYHPRGRRLVSIGQDRLIRLWDVVTRQEILDFEEHVGNLRHVAFSADGRSLAGAGPGVVRVWQAGKEMAAAKK